MLVPVGLECIRWAGDRVSGPRAGSRNPNAIHPLTASQNPGLRARDLHERRVYSFYKPGVSQASGHAMHDAYGILVIEASDWDAEQLRALLRSLSKPVRILKAADLEEEGTRVDVIILGFTDAVSLETSRATLEKARSLSPSAQLILCVPRDSQDLDRKVLELKARAFVLEADRRGNVPRTDGANARVDSSAPRAPGARARVQAFGARRRDRRHECPHPSRAGTHRPRGGEHVDVGAACWANRASERASSPTPSTSARARRRGPSSKSTARRCPRHLLESELFGYEPGAFTDARAQKIGLIELADGGTLFLDEITEIDPVTQAKLLKFLDTKRFRRLGGDREITVETRVIAASNRDIKDEVRIKRFREDLYYRLNVVEIRVPALRERREDIETIARPLLRQLQEEVRQAQPSAVAGRARDDSRISVAG